MLIGKRDWRAEAKWGLGDLGERMSIVHLLYRACAQGTTADGLRWSAALSGKDLDRA